jgi:shikimate kinase
VQRYHNLVLTGFMGTGKTTVGRELALRLDMEFVDTDELIESRHGPIAAIFEKLGEAAFREMERAIAVELGQRRGLVIATGGRMVLDPVSSTELSRHGRIFCLAATPDEVHRRVIELMAERQDDYGRFPQVITDNRDPVAIANEVAELWNGDIIDTDSGR